MPDVLEARLVEGEVGAAEAVEVGDEGLVGGADGEDEGWGESGDWAVDSEIVVYARCGCGGEAGLGGIDWVEDLSAAEGVEVLVGFDVMEMKDR